MIAPRIASLLALLALIAPVEVFAQQEPIVAPGDRVRVLWLGTAPLVSTVLALKADTLVLAVEDRGAPLELPLALVRKFEVSRGGSNALRGALIGAGLGLALGAADALGQNDGDLIGPEVVMAVLGGAGATLGLVIGAMSRSDRWEEVPLDELRVSLMPHKTPALTVSMSLRL